MKSLKRAIRDNERFWKMNDCSGTFAFGPLSTKTWAS